MASRSTPRLAPAHRGDLMRYCFHVAGAVGVMMAVVMGVAGDDHDTLDRACDLGLAFQLNNIARDMSEDDAGGAATCRSNGWSKPTFRPAST
jgi:phytoene/squalene synthetase